MGKKLNVATTVTTVHKYSTTITADEIREKFGLPKEARVYFHVPGGSDWANMALDIDAEHPVHVEWEEHREGEAQTTKTMRK
jgi:hypothetical protein